MLRPFRSSDLAVVQDLVVAAGMFTAEEAAEGVWDLTMIAVDPARQGAGIGHELLRHVEVTLAAQGARLLAVRTSGTAQYDGARVFYERARYDRAATVRNWWTDGDDLVLYVKRLQNEHQET